MAHHDPSMSVRRSGSARPPALTHLAVAGYRSLQQLVLPLDTLTVVFGANGSGKSNLYRALGLVTAAARGDLVAALAAEGGLPAVFWAGPERTSRAMRSGEQPVQGGTRTQATRLRLGIAGEMLSYALELGYRADDADSAFALDPEIKREWIWAGGPFHPSRLLVRRTGAVVERLDGLASVGGRGGGRSQPLAQGLSPHESLFTAVSDPLEAPEVFQLRRSILSWRFYAGFRTDREAPARSGREPPALSPWRRMGAIWRPPCRRSWKLAMALACRPPSPMRSPAVGWRWTPCSRSLA